MSDPQPDAARLDLAAEHVQRMLEEAEKKDLCPHCVGLDMIYIIAREITAHLETDPAELFRVLHIGIREGEDMQLDEAVDEADGDVSWSVH